MSFENDYWDSLEEEYRQAEETLDEDGQDVFDAYNDRVDFENAGGCANAPCRNAGTIPVPLGMGSDIVIFLCPKCAKAKGII